jgi:cytochrome bd-type quinol oxidase subunit 2
MQHEKRAPMSMTLDPLLLTGVALVFGYAVLGAGWLVMKT